MTHVLAVCIPVFGLCLLGYLVTRFGWFDEKSAEGLARFVFDWAVPFALFRLFATQALPDEFPWPLLASFYLPVLLLYLVVFTLSPIVFGLDSRARVIAAMGSTYGNSVLLGLPLMLLAFGDEGTVPFLVLISVHSLLLLSLSAVLLEYGKQKVLRASALYRSVVVELSSNPILIGIAAGLIFNYLDLRLPGPVDRITEYMQQAVAACSLFALGAALTRYSIVGRVRETGSVVLLKNVVLPVMVWVCADLIFGLAPAETIAAVVLAALPTGINLYLFAERYGSGQRLATTTIFVSTAASMVTLMLALLWVRALH